MDKLKQAQEEAMEQYQDGLITFREAVEQVTRARKREELQQAIDLTTKTHLERLDINECIKAIGLDIKGPTVTKEDLYL